MSVIKKTLLLSIVLVAQSTFGLTFNNETVFTVGDSVSLDKALKDHADAFNTYALFREQMTYEMWQDGRNRYWNSYDPCKTKLHATSVFNACGNGFMIGSLAAVLNKFVASNAIDKRILYGSFISSVLLVFYQNRALGNVPYFSFDLEKHESYFENFNSNSFSRVLSSIVATSIGFFGTKYMVDKMTEQYDEIIKKKNEAQEPLNQLL